MLNIVEIREPVEIDMSGLAFAVVKNEEDRYVCITKSPLGYAMSMTDHHCVICAIAYAYHHLSDIVDLADLDESDITPLKSETN